ncbi:MAG: SCP2 sterol-binding domain-containing protein [Thermaerobacter sp.]|nr:SCP2 sterol-binding domain-containing protein [Thermaerobacter sp.]
MTTREVFAELQGRLAEKTGQLTNSQGTYQFNLTGDDAAQYWVTVDENGARISEGTILSAGVTVTMDAQDFKELAQGRLNPMTAFMSGKLSVAGDMSMALRLQSLIG